MDGMDIAALSMSMSSTKVMVQAGVSVTKKAMNQEEIAMQGLLEMMPQDAYSQAGLHVDTRG